MSIKIYKKHIFIFLATIVTLIGSTLIFRTHFCKPALAVCSDNISDTKLNTASSEIAPRYYMYSENILSKMSLQNKKTILYFWAPWCTTCKALDIEIENNPNLIPEDLVIFQINFDEDKYLKQKYGVTTQHTFVWIDKNGEELKKWVGGDSGMIVEMTR